MKTLIIPVDFSSCAKNALRFGLRFAQAMDADIRILNVVPLMVTSPSDPLPPNPTEVYDPDTIHERLRDFLDRTVEDEPSLAELPALMRVDTMVQAGFVAPSIVQAAKEDSEAWILLGTEGVHGRLEAVFGSTASAVVNKARNPVLVIPDTFHWNHPINKLAAAVSHPVKDENVLRTLNEWAKAFDATMNFVHVVEEEQVLTTGATANSLSAYDKIPGHVRVQADTLTGHSVEAALRSYCEDEDVDGLVMWREEHTIMDRLLHGSETKRMVLRSEKPLLIWPPARES